MFYITELARVVYCDLHKDGSLSNLRAEKYVSERIHFNWNPVVQILKFIEATNEEYKD